MQGSEIYLHCIKIPDSTQSLRPCKAIQLFPLEVEMSRVYESLWLDHPFQFIIHISYLTV